MARKEIHPSITSTLVMMTALMDVVYGSVTLICVDCGELSGCEEVVQGCSSCSSNKLASTSALHALYFAH